ncbi:hypothetical protein Taro_056191 [Colocasia esculenta]|uniref:Uncharacterized protein n=1 Tax=Colocasia esculenta TaxID=4460 RepID=A0A843XSV4_COLES|nr:hypothetical protein [Colocasia esculenta]
MSQVDLTVEQGIATCPMSPSGLLNATGPMSPSHVQRVKCSGREHKPQFAPFSLCKPYLRRTEAWELHGGLGGGCLTFLQEEVPGSWGEARGSSELGGGGLQAYEKDS